MKSLYERLLPEYRKVIDEKKLEDITLNELKNSYFVNDLKFYTLVCLRSFFVIYGLKFDLNIIYDYFEQ